MSKQEEKEPVLTSYVTETEPTSYTDQITPGTAYFDGVDDDAKSPQLNAQASVIIQKQEEQTCLETIKVCLQRHSDSLEAMLASVLKEVGDLNFERFKKDVQLKEFQEILAQSLLTAMRSTDVSLSNKLSNALLGYYQADRDEKQLFDGEKYITQTESDVRKSLNNKRDALNLECLNFVEAAKRLGEFIISEKHVSPLAKIVKAIQIGGVAGGEKFIANSILLKIAKDVVVTASGQYLYSGSLIPRDELALKVSLYF
jgi:hypothetical protein